jgi:XTP/dITP diphosphohydrolase
MMELLVATRNKKKLQEIKELLADLPFHVTSLDDYKDLPKIIEDGKTFEQNAIKKAATIAMATGRFVLGEDSGLEVKALRNQPGVYSARYSGDGATDRKNNAKLLRELRNVPLKKRTAHYRCAVAIAGPKGLLGVVSGSCSGVIGTKEKGTAGFGYDPLFVIPQFDKTFAELGLKVKHAMSHRYKALKKARRLMEGCLKRHR